MFIVIEIRWNFVLFFNLSSSYEARSGQEQIDKEVQPMNTLQITQQ